MDSSLVYPLENCKILHLIRHGQARHNLKGENDREALLSPELFDPSLSSLGWQQVDELPNQVIATGLLNRIELVITSPLLRTMQTANGVFDNQNDNSPPPIIALELVRDRNGLRPPDQRRNVSECRSLFPAIDFSLIESEHDNLWNPLERESVEELSSRGTEFIKWLWTREEKEIVVVSHGIVLQYILYALPRNLSAPRLYDRFGHCEHRTVVIVDTSTTHQDPSAI